MFTVAEDVNLLNGQFTASLNIITQKHLTKATDTKNSTFLPLRWRHRRYTQHALHFIQHDNMYLTCSKKLMGSQLRPPHGTNKKINCETKNKTMSMIGPVQSHYHEGHPVGKKKSKVGRI